MYHDEEEKIVWYDCLTGLEGAPAMHYERLTERNIEDFGMKNGRVLEEVLEEIDLNVGKLSEFPAGDNMDKTEKRRKRVKPKKAGLCRYNTFMSMSLLLKTLIYLQYLILTFSPKFNHLKIFLNFVFIKNSRIRKFFKKTFIDFFCYKILILHLICLLFSIKSS